jgi:predicted negative regulator of RcsB-dependent stress response
MSPSSRQKKPVVQPTRSRADDRADAFFAWTQANGRTIAAAVMVAAAVVGAGFLYQSATAKREGQAEAALVGPRQSIAVGNVPLAVTDLKRVISRYKGTGAATQAAMLLATTNYDQKKYADGLSVLQQAQTTGAGKPFAASVASLEGDGYSQEGKYRDAASAYQRAATATPYPTERDRLRATAARAFVAASDTTAAVAIWTQLAGDSKSPEYAEARLRLGELTTKPIGNKA